MFNEDKENYSKESDNFDINNFLSEENEKTQDESFAEYDSGSDDNALSKTESENTYVYKPVETDEQVICNKQPERADAEPGASANYDGLADMPDEENYQYKVTDNTYTFSDNSSVYENNESIASDNAYTYPYTLKPDDEESAKEAYYAKTLKKMKRLSVVSVCCALIISIVSVSLAGFTVFRKNSGKPSNFRTGNGNNTNSAVSSEQFVPTGEYLSTEEIAAKVGPAVVGIINTTKMINFFNQTSTAQSSGSGVIINEEGYIVTNFHVIENADELKVVLNTGKECETEVIGYDSRSDLAVLKIEEKDLIYASFGDSSQVSVGQTVIAIGNPLGTELMGTVTQGIVSAVNRTVNVENKTLTLLQTDAAINNGNSGGPLVNAYGEIIGINSVKMAATGVEGIGFAIPSNEVKNVVDDLINNGYVTGRLMVGVSGTNITEKLSGYYDLPVGFYVNEVYEGYGAYLAGVQTGDVIIKCDGQKVETVDDINAIRDTHKVNDMMEVVVWRNGKEVTLKIKLMEENPEITQ